MLQMASGSFHGQSRRRPSLQEVLWLLCRIEYAAPALGQAKSVTMVTSTRPGGRALVGKPVGTSGHVCLGTHPHSEGHRCTEVEDSGA